MLDHDLGLALKEIEIWSDDWQLPISVSKCKALHIGGNNPIYDYSLFGNTLESVSTTFDLGVWITGNLKSTTHCNHIVKTAKQRCALIRKCFVSNNRDILFWAFCVFVRPLLEYASPVWSPHLHKDIDYVESVQRRFTKYLPGLKSKSYSERLKLLKAESLDIRRLKIDLSLTYSILHGAVDIDSSIFFSVRGSQRTRGHPLKLVVQKTKLDCSKFFFANRVVNVWNGLPEDVVMASSIQNFKKGLAGVCLSEYVRWSKYFILLASCYAAFVFAFVFAFIFTFIVHLVHIAILIFFIFVDLNLWLA